MVVGAPRFIGLLFVFSYTGVLTLIRAKEEDSGNYTMRVENGDQRRDVVFILEVKGQHATF